MIRLPKVVMYTPGLAFSLTRETLWTPTTTDRWHPISLLQDEGVEGSWLTYFEVWLANCSHQATVVRPGE